MKSYLSLLLIICLTAPALAESPVAPKMAKQYIAEILSQPEFKTTREEYRWHYIGESSPDTPPEPTSTASNFISFIAQLFELLLWILLAVGIILLIIYGSPWLKKLRPPANPDYTANPHLLEEKLAILPTDIPQQAWKLWQSDNAVLAISLLYRGALSVLTTRDELTIDESATESECLRLVKYKQPIELSAYFSILTSTWQNIAYAGRQPSNVEAQRLCDQWQQYFS